MKMLVLLFASVFVCGGCGTIQEHDVDFHEGVRLKYPDGYEMNIPPRNILPPQRFVAPSVQSQTVITQPSAVEKTPPVPQPQQMFRVTATCPRCGGKVHLEVPAERLTTGFTAKITCRHCGDRSYPEIEVKKHSRVDSWVSPPSQVMVYPRLGPNSIVNGAVAQSDAADANPVRWSEKTFRFNFNGMNQVYYHHEQGTRNWMESGWGPYDGYVRKGQEPYSRTTLDIKPPVYYSPYTYQSGGGYRGTSAYGGGGTYYYNSGRLNYYTGR